MILLMHLQQSLQTSWSKIIRKLYKLEISKNCLSNMSILNLNNWFMKIRRLWVLSMFSRLEELEDIKNLMLSDTEDLRKS